MTGVGLCLPQLGPHATGPAIKDFCHAAEDRGYTSLWVQEHLFVPVDAISGYGGAPGRALPTPYQSTLAALELLAAAAAWTTTPLIGTSVIVGGYHRPVELAQSLAAVDVLSQGRLVVGLGVGWSEDEHIQMNTDVHSRGRRLDELIDALKACWGPNPVEHRGEFFSIPSCLVNPKPVQHKLPMIGGAFSGPGLERVIDKLDGWNPAGLPVSTVATMAADINAKRNPDNPISVWYRSFLQPPSKEPRTVADVVDDVTAACDAGFQEVVIDANFADAIDSPSAWVRLIDELLPALDASHV